jgi:hypothetical protein
MVANKVSRPGLPLELWPTKLLLAYNPGVNPRATSTEIDQDGEI